MKDRCKKCGVEVEIPQMHYDTDPEHTGWYNFFNCPNCGAEIVDIDDRVDMTREEI